MDFQWSKVIIQDLALSFTESNDVSAVSREKMHSSNTLGWLLNFTVGSAVQVVVMYSFTRLILTLLCCDS